MAHLYFDVRATGVMAIQDPSVDISEYQTLGKQFESRKRPK